MLAPCHLLRTCLAIFAAFSLVGSTTFADVVESRDYPFPFQDPYVSTLTFAIYHSLSPYQKIEIVVRPDRAQVPLLEGKNKIQMGLFAQNHPAPLVFVIQGMGADGLSGAGMMLAEDFYKMGYHAVTLPNPMAWQYVVGVSESTLPGYMPRDSREYYRFMQKVTAELQSRNVQILDYSVAGFSLGGLLTGFLAEQDAVQKSFDFQKVLIINPPVDVAYDIDVLDQLYAVGEAIPSATKDTIMGGLINAAVSLLSGPVNAQEISKVLQQIPLKETELRWVIGNRFRESVRDVIFSSQQIRDLGILKKKATASQRNSRLAEAKSFKFSEYIQRFVLPDLQRSLPIERRNASLEELLQQTSLTAIQASLQFNPRVFVMGNADDFLIRPSDVDALKTIFADRLYLYPYGGHVGNIWYERNRRDLHTIMSHR